MQSLQEYEAEERRYQRLAEAHDVGGQGTPFKPVS